MGTTHKKPVTITHPETGEDVEVSPQVAEFVEAVDMFTAAARKLIEALQEALARPSGDPKC